MTGLEREKEREREKETLHLFQPPRAEATFQGYALFMSTSPVSAHPLSTGSRTMHPFANQNYLQRCSVFTRTSPVF